LMTLSTIDSKNTMTKQRKIIRIRRCKENKNKKKKKTKRRKERRYRKTTLYPHKAAQTKRKMWRARRSPTTCLQSHQKTFGSSNLVRIQTREKVYRWRKSSTKSETSSRTQQRTDAEHALCKNISTIHC
jgi:hypothetical protein